jgi:hypothetical protein
MRRGLPVAMTTITPYGKSRDRVSPVGFLRAHDETRFSPSQSSALPLADRPPTFHKIATFDAGAAWDRLTPKQQREIGMLAVRFGTVGQCEGYFHETIEAVQSGFMTAHWRNS